jgi:hypothetical protein
VAASAWDGAGSVDLAFFALGTAGLLPFGGCGSPHDVHWKLNGARD